jgi:hypothetical protein
MAKLVLDLGPESETVPLELEFDPPFVKCYKSWLCACPCSRSSGCFAGGIWGNLEPVCGGFFPAE